MLAEKRKTSPPIVGVFRITYFCPSWKRPTCCIMVTNGIDQGAWLQKKLENLSAAPDELDHACREA